MYVCVCKSVTERQIHQAVRDGARTLKDLRCALGVSSECGQCATCARQCLKEAIEEQRQAEIASRLAA
jgi:bacterioferritin-associated ferredoxin